MSPVGVCVIRVGQAQDCGSKYGDVQHDATISGFLPPDITAVDDVMKYMTLNVFRTACEAGEKAGKETQSGSTLTTAVITPDGHLVQNTLGDSPLMIFAVDAQNRVTGQGLINTLHHPNPYMGNVIDEGALKSSWQNMLGDGSGRYMTAAHLSDYAQPGERLIIVPASDGVFDGIGNPPMELDFDQAVQWGHDQRQARVKAFSSSVQAAMMTGGDPRKLAEGIIATTEALAGKQGRDNISVNVAIVDPNDLPERALLLGVADGNGPQGGTVSNAVVASMQNHVQLLMDATKRMTHEDSARAVAGSPWMEVTTSQGFPAKYLDVGGMDRRERARIETALSMQDIRFQEKRSSLNGGTTVLAVTGEDYLKVHGLQNPPAPAPAAAAAATDKAPDAKGGVFKRTLGKLGF
ncbi:MAG: protein phosphatase 2C family protein [Alphaproteobacteria bacterium]|nr:protein phosphatase 2C family protein [Alphaproteobacteria bacterium]USO07497.1 MAG: protein phosphatase 2C family protein [Rhodospirillales bacterium]